MTVLLAMLIATVFIVPVVFPSDGAERAARDVPFTLILIASAVTVYARRPLALAAAALCVAAIAVRWAEFIVPAGVQPLARESASLLALGVVTWIIAARVFADGAVTADRIMGAVALYLLLGLGWAVAYDLVALHVPGAFNVSGAERVGPQRWVYFSFVTLTTVGYGDITPVARAAQSLATLEALVGQLYPAIILARLVSLHTR
jgi:hypothetical protein